MPASLDFLRPALPLWGVCEYPRELFPPARPGRLPAGARSVIAAAFPYRLPEEHYAGRNVSRYAVPPDYHAVCGARLEQACALLRAAWPGEAFVWFCDNTPLPEVALAERAGLGARGKHGLLITRDYGSWVFLGEIITTAALPPAPRPLPPAPCGACSAPCAAACPVGLDKARCLSAVTQRKGALRPEEEDLLRRARTAWGCDLCQEACPANQNVCVDPLPELSADPLPRVTPGTPCAGRAYAWRGEGLLRRNLEALGR
jgi:epoxyqueuosine reductase QueG